MELRIVPEDVSQLPWSQDTVLRLWSTLAREELLGSEWYLRRPTSDLVCEPLLFNHPTANFMTLQASLREVLKPLGLTVASDQGCVSRLSDVQPFDTFLSSAGFHSDDPGAAADFLLRFGPGVAAVAGLLRESSDHLDRYQVMAGLLLSHLRASTDASDLVTSKFIAARALFPLRMFSLRSHIEGLLASISDPERLLSRFDAAYDPVAGNLRALVRRTVAGGEPDNDAERRWYRNELRWFEEARTQLCEGALRPTGGAFDGLTSGQISTLPSVEFGSVNEYRDALRNLLHETADFQAFRLMSSVVYEAMFDLGFSISERYFLCYAVSRAGSEVTGISSVEALDSIRRLALAVKDQPLKRLPETGSARVQMSRPAANRASWLVAHPRNE